MNQGFKSAVGRRRGADLTPKCKGSNPPAPTGQSVSNAYGIGLPRTNVRVSVLQLPASPNGELNAFVGHGRADISARTLLAAFSSSFAAANQARTSLSRLARIASSLFCSASIKPYRAQAKNSSSSIPVRGIPWAFLSLRQVALNRLSVCDLGTPQRIFHALQIKAIAEIFETR
jgi:hypothetical protein